MFVGNLVVGRGLNKYSGKVRDAGFLNFSNPDLHSFPLLSTEKKMHSCIVVTVSKIKGNMNFRGKNGFGESIFCSHKRPIYAYFETSMDNRHFCLFSLFFRALEVGRRGENIIFCLSSFDCKLHACRPRELI